MKPLLLIIEHPEGETTDAAVAFAERTLDTGRVWVLRMAGRPTMIAPTEHYEGLSDEFILDRLLATEESAIHVVLDGFAPDALLPPGWLRTLASLQVLSIHHVDRGGHVERLGAQSDTLDEELANQRLVTHRPLTGNESRVLVVFPGPIVPTSMGSHQRVFGILEALRAAQVSCDVLIAAERPAVIKRARTILEQMCPRVYVGGLSKRRLPPLLQARHGLEIAVRRSLGQKARPPRLFEERMHTAASFSSRVKLRRILRSNQYHTVLVNYAWMEPIRALLPEPVVRGHRWICDTHDVQFVRGATHNRGEVRLGVSQQRERELELRVLSRFDKVLAISPSDAVELRKHLDGSSVVEVPTGFDYAKQDARLPNVDAPVFGFIGASMDANVKAVERLLCEWWPAITSEWPDAQLLIAGKIAEDKTVQASAFLRSGVELLGFVNSLRAFHHRLDALLNPVVVQGGLNFKSAECLMAGRVLATTELGEACLGESGLALTGESGPDIVEKLRSEFAASDYLERRSEVARRAAERFGDVAAYGPLTELIREGGGASDNRTRPSKARRRVLIQVGDHFENWERVLPLAVSIRERGHHPIALVYERDGYNFFMAHGVDAVALRDFHEPYFGRRVRRLSTRLHGKLVPKFYSYFDLDDLAAAQRESRNWNAERALAFRRNALRHIHRADALLDRLAPDVLLVWNGYTGITANVLRQAAEVRGLGVGFLERSIVPGAVYVDRRGVNGYSNCSRASIDDVRAFQPATVEPSHPVHATARVVGSDEMELLRRSGPWRTSDRIVFIPLQVESDTNVRLHSPDVNSMWQLVERAWEEFHDERTAIVVRPHPEETASIKLPTLDQVFVDATGDLQTWLRIADLVVTINSTVGLTALLHGTPVIAWGKSIYSGKGFTEGVMPAPGDLDAYLAYLVEMHTACGRGLPRDLEAHFPALAQDAYKSWRGLNGLLPDVLDWWRQWESFTAQVRLEAERKGELAIETDVTFTDRLDLTYRRLAQPINLDWLEKRARTVFSLSDEVEFQVTWNGGALARVSEPGRIIVSRNRPRLEPRGFVLDRYLAPWVPAPENSAASR